MKKATIKFNKYLVILVPFILVWVQISEFSLNQQEKKLKFIILITKNQCLSVRFVDKLLKQCKYTPSEVESDLSEFHFWSLALMKTDLLFISSIHLELTINGKPPLLVKIRKTPRLSWKRDIVQIWKLKMPFILHS